MTIYVDGMVSNGWRMRGNAIKNCHMFSDSEDLAELHAFAKRIGMRREWFQDKRVPHYDLTVSRRRLAVAAGAVEVDRRQAVDLWARIQARRAGEFTRWT